MEELIIKVDLSRKDLQSLTSRVQFVVKGAEPGQNAKSAEENGLQ